VIQTLNHPIAVPGNASRSLRSAEAARAQPYGRIQLGWDKADPYLRNILFDLSIVRYDESYCTSVSDLSAKNRSTLPTLDFFSQICEVVGKDIHITDVGCGQGEFVTAVRALGFDGYGYDPVLQSESSYLFPTYWDPVTSPETDLVVMRCVLPHVPQPWSFLDHLAKHQSSALVLIEFQKLEWILDTGCWYQLCHDHVNQFSMNDFRDRYEIMLEGSFSNDEWGWVLFDPRSRRAVEPKACVWEDALERLFRARADFLRDFGQGDQRCFVWGAAAKGTVLSDALHQVGRAPERVIDANPDKWSLFLEGCGIEVISPSDARQIITYDADVLVANPNHLEDVVGYLDRATLRVFSPTRM
jgi:hypothetical protein